MPDRRHDAKRIIVQILALLLWVSALPSTRAACIFPVEPGWNLVANQCVNDNTVATLLPVVPPGTLLLKFNNTSGTFEPLNVFSTAWSYPQQRLAPGDGAWIFNPGVAAFVAGFPGAGATPVLPVPFASCSSSFLVSRQTDAAGNYLNIMGLAPAPGALVYKFDAVAQSFDIATYGVFDPIWEPAELTAGIGEALWISPTGNPPPPVPSLCKYTKVIPPGWSLFANQCVNARTIRSLIPSPPFGTLVRKYNNGTASFEPFNAFSTAWSNPDQMLGPGEGAWIFNPGVAPFNVFIAGTAGSDTPVTASGAGFFLVSRKSAGVGNYANIMGAPPAEGALVYKFDSVAMSFLIATYNSVASAWEPAELTAGIGESLWISPTGAGSPPTSPALCSYTKVIPPGWSLFANQCVNSSTVASLLPGVPFGTLLLKYNNATASFEPLNGFSSCWSEPTQTLAPGEGAWIFNPGIAFSVFIAGTEGPGTPVAAGGAGYFLVSRKFAGTGDYDNIMGAAPAPGAVVYKFNPAALSFDIATFDPIGLAWDPAALTAGVGEALWISPTGAGPVPTAPTVTTYTKAILPGWNAIANQCANANTVSSLMPCVPHGTELWKYNNATMKYESPNVFKGSWKLPSQTLAPGEGAFIRNPTPTPFSILITGAPGPGGLNTATATGCYLVSRKSVGSATYANIMAANPPPEGTCVYRFNPVSQSFDTACYVFDEWGPMGELTAAVGEPLWITLGGGGCPPAPCYLDISASLLCQYVTISWPCTGCTLQQTSVLANPSSATVWTPVPGTSPLTLPIAAGNKFFRLSCP